MHGVALAVRSAAGIGWIKMQSERNLQQGGPFFPLRRTTRASLHSSASASIVYRLLSLLNFICEIPLSSDVNVFFCVTP